MKITWTRCLDYEQARNFIGIIYLHEWHGKPFYWGKAHNSFFGGHMRAEGVRRVSGRYNAGYRHWIEGCLRHGARLYIGQLDAKALENIDDVENFLIHTYEPEMKQKKKPIKDLSIEHVGAIPEFISSMHHVVASN